MIRHEWVWEHEWVQGRCLHPHCFWVQKDQMNLITTGRVWVSWPLLCVPATEPAFIDKVPFIGPCNLPQFGAKKSKATDKVTLQEPPIILVLSLIFTLCCKQLIFFKMKTTNCSTEPAPTKTTDKIKRAQWQEQAFKTVKWSPQVYWSVSELHDQPNHHKHLSFSKLNSIEFTESIEFVEDYF